MGGGGSSRDNLGRVGTYQVGIRAMVNLLARIGVLRDEEGADGLADCC